MERSLQDFNWLLDDDGLMVGITLGYDRTHQHEVGTTPILGALGIVLAEYPLGVSSRAAARAPERLTFATYKRKPRDKRRKAEPAAYLMLEPKSWGWRTEPSDGAAKLGLCRVDFYGDPGDKWWTERNDIAAAWDNESFCIHVRGDVNIARLKRLHEAFLAIDIAVAMPWAKAFFRGGLAFTIPSLMAQTWKDEVLAMDLAHQELCEAAKATGIAAALEAAGKRSYALSPDWADREAKDEVIFFLNPCDQRNAHFGWHTVEELRDWIAGKGVVVKDPKLEAFDKLPENKDWSYNLLKGMNEAGLHTRYHSKLTWLDEAKTIPGIKIRMASKCRHLLADGIYPFDQLMAQHAAPAKAEPATTAG